MSQPPAPRVPAGWEAVWDASYSRYYFHADSTGESVWTVPTQAALAPPAAPVSTYDTGPQNNDNYNNYNRAQERGRTDGNNGYYPQRERSRSRERGYGQGQGQGQGQGNGYGYGEQQQYQQQGGYNQRGNYNERDQYNQRGPTNYDRPHHQQHQQQGVRQPQQGLRQPPSHQNNRRVGDWDCQHCGGHNYASKIACFKCAAPKPAQLDASGMPPNNFRFGIGNRHEAKSGSSASKAVSVAKRAGDWVCTECSMHNFARNNTCFKCRAPVQAGQRIGTPVGHIDRSRDNGRQSGGYGDFGDHGGQGSQNGGGYGNSSYGNSGGSSSSSSSGGGTSSGFSCAVCKESFSGLNAWLKHTKNKGDRAHAAWREKNQKIVIDRERELNGGSSQKNSSVTNTPTAKPETDQKDKVKVEVAKMAEAPVEGVVNDAAVNGAEDGEIAE